MNQDERRLYLIKYLLKEEIHYKQSIPEDIQTQRQLLRALMNVRMPRPVSQEFLKIQDEYLKQRAKERGIVSINDLQPVKSNERLFIYQGDITTLECDGIVNACNNKMLGCFQPNHACIDNFIHTYAGIQLRLEMNEIMKKQGYDEPTGIAKITSAYNLPAKYILHTVGPIIYNRVTQKERDQLASCYKECLELASLNGLESIAFCCLSTGVFRFPQKEAAMIAIQTVQEFLKTNTQIKKVIFNVFKDSDYTIYNDLLNK